MRAAAEGNEAKEAAGWKREWGWGMSKSGWRARGTTRCTLEQAVGGWWMCVPLGVDGRGRGRPRTGSRWLALAGAGRLLPAPLALALIMRLARLLH